MADQIRRFIELSRQLPDADAILAAMRAQQQFEQQQATRGHQDDLTGLLLVVIKEIIDINFFTFVWLGRVLIGRAIPDTSSLSEEDTVLVRKIPASSEYIHIIRGREAIFYGISAEEDADFNHEAELWRYVSGIHTKIYTTSSGWSSTVFGVTFITCIFYVPINNTLYFLTHETDFTVFDHELDRLYKVDLNTLTVTEISVTFDENVDENDADNVRQPPINDAAYFKGDVYLCQLGHDDILQAGGSEFNPRVYKFNVTTETLTTVFIHPQAPGGPDSVASLAVQGIDAELMFAYYLNIGSTGRIYSSTDGSSWSLLTTIDINAEIVNMMTDRSTGDVYVSCGGRAPPVAFPTSIYRYDGTLPLTEDLNLESPSPDGWFATPSLGARYVGSSRQEIWHVNPSDREAPPRSTDDDARFKGTSWLFATEDINDVLPSGYTISNPSGPSQVVMSYQGELMFLTIEGTSPRALQLLVRHESTGWEILKDVGYTHEIDSVYDIDFAMCRAGTAVLPHEQ